MPIFDFKCNDCGERFTELLASYFEKDKVSCPKCGSKNVTLLISACGFGRSNGLIFGG
ncbi:MAG: FmdB family zinc ribbon protein [Thermacetogeniaceae bacterium]